MPLYVSHVIMYLASNASASGSIVDLARDGIPAAQSAGQTSQTRVVEIIACLFCVVSTTGCDACSKLLFCVVMIYC